MNRAGDTVQRLLLAVGATYCLTASVVALGAFGLSRVLAPSEAVALASMSGFVLYLLLLLWACAEPRLARLWWLLGGGGLIGQLAVRMLANAGS